MFKGITLGFCLFIAGLLCLNPPSRAQLTLSGVGGGFGGAVSPTCGGTAITLTNPDTLASAPWAHDANLTAANNAAVAPDSSMTAATLLANATNAYGEVIGQQTSALGTAAFSLSGYFKVQVSPTSLLFVVSDNVANTVGAWFALTGGGTVGTNNDGGDGVSNCAKITSQGSGWYLVSIGGAFGTSRTNFAEIFLCDADAACTGTVGQIFDAWHVGQ